MINKLYTIAKTKKYYVKMTTYILILSMIPLLSISVFLFRNTKANVESQISEANKRYLEQTVNAIEIVVKQIQDSFRQLAMDTNMRNYETFPRAAYYESNTGYFDDNELYSLYIYLENKKRVLDQINTLKLSNEFIKSVYYFDNKKQIVFTDETLQYRFKEFYDTQWKETFMNMDSQISVVTRKGYYRDGNFEDYLSIIYKSYSSNLSGFIINIDINSICTKIIENSTGNEDVLFYAFLPQNELVFKNKEGDKSNFFEIREVIESKKNIEKKFFNKIQIGDRDYLISMLDSQMIGWSFIYMIDYDKVYDNFNQKAELILLVTLGIIFLTVMFSVIISLKIYKPISGIVVNIKAIRNNDGNNNLVEVRGEMDVITDTLMSTFNEKKILQKKLEESIPAYKDKFLYKLLRKIDFSRSEIVKRLNTIGLEIDVNNLVVINFVIENLNVSQHNVKEIIYYNIEIVNFIESSIKKKYNVACVENENNIIAIVNCYKSEMKNIFVLIDDIKIQIINTLKCDCTVGISSFCEEVEQLPKAYNESKEALRYRLVYGTNEVIYFDDVVFNKVNEIKFPKAKTMTLYDYIKNGQTENSMLIFNEILKELKEVTTYKDYHYVKQFFIQLLTELINVFYDVGLSLEAIIGEKKNIYSVIIEENNMDSIEEWFSQIIYTASDYIANASNEKNNNCVGKIINMLDEDVGPSITLNYVADQLNMNPTYISRVFKKTTGKNFTDYLTHLRIKKSKTLLESTDFKVKDIAEKVGYNNSYYFIKVFKEYTGTTPGEYKKLK